MQKVACFTSHVFWYVIITDDSYSKNLASKKTKKFCDKPPARVELAT